MLIQEAACLKSTTENYRHLLQMRTMKKFVTSIVTSTLFAAIAVSSPLAQAQTSGGNDTTHKPCTMGTVTGVGGSAQSIREYLATPDRDKFRYITDHPIQCKISDDGRATDCTGVTTLRRDDMSVYDDSDSTTMTVVVRVELDRGTYPAIIVVPRTDVQCTE
jgi:hypothetical protein